jgi:hypothetical protein
MTPEEMTTRVLRQAHGKLLTDSGARKAIEKGLNDYGEQKLKEGMRLVLNIAGEISDPKVRLAIANIMEMI